LLSRVSDILEDYGTRVQYSVFECILDKQKFEELKEKIKTVVDSEDSVRFYFICESCLSKIDIIGTGEIIKDPDVYII